MHISTTRKAQFLAVIKCIYVLIYLQSSKMTPTFVVVLLPGIGMDEDHEHP